METIKKTILQALTTGTTSGCKDNCRIIIPDLAAVYYIKISLTQEAHDFGFFDADIIDSFPYSNQEPIGLGNLTNNIIITGVTANSRLIELKKYTKGVPFSQQYFGNGSISVDGVDYNNSTENMIVIYYIGGIKFIDTYTGSATTTTFSFIGQGYNSLDFINVPYYKDFNKENIISNPEINNDIFIIRQELSAFDSNYRLEYITDLIDLTTYAGGRFFNIVNDA